MKLIVKEHINAVAQPIMQTYSVVPEAVGSVNKIPLSIGLEKGDILVYRGEGDLVRLPVGTNGQVLTADSSAELGVKWADPS